MVGGGGGAGEGGWMGQRRCRKFAGEGPCYVKPGNAILLEKIIVFHCNVEYSTLGPTHTDVNQSVKAVGQERLCGTLTHGRGVNFVGSMHA